MLAGIGFVILSVACFAILDTTTKHISASVPILLAQQDGHAGADVFGGGV